MRNKKKIKWIKLGIIYSFSLLICIYVLIPFYWMVVTSLKTNQEVYAFPVTYWPKELTFTNYIDVLNNNNVDFLQFFENSIIIAVSTTILAMIIASLAAYAFARFRFKSKGFLGVSILSTQMLPSVLFIVPYFLIFKAVGLTNTLTGLIIINLTYALPFCIWTLRGYFEKMPYELEESALIDGCTRLQTLYKIILPLAKPVIVTTSIFSFIHAWNEFLFAFIISPQNPTLTVGLYQYIGSTYIPWNHLMAHATLTILPCFIIFSFLQRHLISGLTSGAVKG